jgi:protein tyrosine/serine phosphatase
MDKRSRKPTFSLSNSSINISLKDQVQAAIVIQKYWKRYIFRKKFIKAMKKQKKKHFISLEMLAS